MYKHTYIHIHLTHTKTEREEREGGGRVDEEKWGRNRVRDRDRKREEETERFYGILGSAESRKTKIIHYTTSLCMSICQLAQLVFLLVLSLSQDYERQSSVSDQLKSNKICGEKARCTMSVDKLLDLDCSVLKTLNHFSG